MALYTQGGAGQPGHRRTRKPRNSNTHTSAVVGAYTTHIPRFTNGEADDAAPLIDQLSFAYEHPELPRASNTQPHEGRQDNQPTGKTKNKHTSDTQTLPTSNTTSSRASVNAFRPPEYKIQAGVQFAWLTLPPRIRFVPAPRSKSVPSTALRTSRTASVSTLSRPASHPLNQPSVNFNSKATNKNVRAILGGTRLPVPRKKARDERPTLKQTPRQEFK